MTLRKLLIFSILTFSIFPFLKADDGSSGGKFKASETIIHHILDNHDWHITDIPDGHGGYTPIAIHLPWLVYSSPTGFKFYSDTHAMHEDGLFVSFHEHAKLLKPDANIPANYHGHGMEAEIEAIVNEDVFVLDLSPTKAVVQMFLIAILLFFIFRSVAKAYVRRAKQAPKGMQSFFEPIILFVRNDISREYLGDKAAKYTPYLLTLFFFIWFSNLLGLTPFNSNIMGNISVTAALAIMSFILIQVNGTKDYWRHIFWMPGVPTAVVPLMTVIEIISLFVKPIALAIRLFANIAAGHFMVLSLICMIFILGKGGESVGGAVGIMPISVIFTVAIFALEMIVAIIQAYIFTLLTAVFISMAMESHDDHDHH